jgi:hypothetical protein
MAFAWLLAACALDAKGLGPLTECSEDSDCAALTCGGRCVAGSCEAPEAPCDDGTLCTEDVCEENGACTHTPVDAACAPEEVCDLVRGCVAAPCAADGDCDDGLACDGVETCLAGSCRPGEAILCDDGVDCTIDTCDEDLDACTSRPPDLDRDGHGARGCLDGDDCNDGRGAVHPGAPDSPGEDDLDCDGLDFDLDGSVFVSPDGDDAGAGTNGDPLQTIGAALALAEAAGFPFVIAAGGDYAGSLVLVDGVGLWGSFDWDGIDAWTRPGAVRTRVLGRAIAIRAVDLASPVTIDGVDVEAADASGAGESSIGILAARCDELSIVDVGIVAGSGRDGQIGATGTNGANGANGTNGSNGNTGGAGGPGGASDCGAEGGVGGDGGVGIASDGADGAAGSGGGAGGAGGDAFFPDGDDGLVGANGADGGAGAPAIGECVMDDLPSGCQGGDGPDGAAGGGGGGGGGGAGGLDFPDDLAGGGGGGGGSGGCPGTGGGGGQGGGGSYGIHATDTAIGLEAVTITTADGGAGGDGARGGDGASGGQPGGGGAGLAGAPRSGAGGRGASGGTGGKGGPGAGGAGGPSYCLVRRGGDRAGTDPICTPGLGGVGGAGATTVGGATSADGAPGGAGAMDES